MLQAGKCLPKACSLQEPGRGTASACAADKPEQCSSLAQVPITNARSHFRERGADASEISGEGEDGRSASGCEGEKVGARSGGGRFGRASRRKPVGDHRNRRLGTRGLGRGYAAAAVVTAGTGGGDGALFRFRGAVTVMAFSQAAGVHGRS